MTFYPALYFLDKPDPLGFTALRVIRCTARGIRFLRRHRPGLALAIRHYRSTGS